MRVQITDVTGTKVRFFWVEFANANPNICTCPHGTPTLAGGSGATLCEANATVDCSACGAGYGLSAPAGPGAQTCVRAITVTASWRQLPPRPGGTGKNSAAVVADGPLLYIAGGSDGGRTPSLGDEFQTYNTVTQQWASLPAIPRPAGWGTASQQTAAAIVSGKFYLIGRWGAKGSPGRYTPYSGLYTGRVDVYSIAGRSWSTAAAMPTVRTGAACVSVGTSIYVIGGEFCTTLTTNSGKCSYLNATEVFDVVGGTWKALPAMPTARYGPSAVHHQGSIYVVGGRNPNPQRTGFLGTLEAFNIQAGTWSTLRPMPTVRYGLAAVVYGGVIAAIGGGSYEWHQCKQKFTTLTVVEGFDIRTGTWHSLPSMPTSRYKFGAAMVQATAYVFGGSQYLCGSSARHLNTMEALDFATSTNIVCTCPHGTPTLTGGSGATLCEANATVDCSACGAGYGLSAPAGPG
eukprot:COSAG01_NODE_12067_length_1805_cov_2.554513_1_plen_459_part_10